MSRLSLRAFSRSLPLLCLASTPGCWALFYDTTTCDLSTFSLDGSTTIGGETFDTSVDWVDLEAADSRECLTRVDATLDLGRGCTFVLSADGRGDVLEVYEANPNNLEGCGLDSLWQVRDYGDSRVEVDGDIHASEFEGTDCYVGELVIVLDLVLSNGQESRPMTGEIMLSGGDVADAIAASCE